MEIAQYCLEQTMQNAAIIELEKEESRRSDGGKEGLLYRRIEKMAKGAEDQVAQLYNHVGGIPLTLCNCRAEDVFTIPGPSSWRWWSCGRYPTYAVVGFGVEPPPEDRFAPFHKDNLLPFLVSCLYGVRCSDLSLPHARKVDNLLRVTPSSNQ
ncbi:hypothetical protein EV356DRAFT_499209 [Viridothelium virens]|uniref:Uncharacterized protein n=1 Tax=Viridothelium virens TaxID=1048519 RepID=A0A6A6HDQ3_VIRVR|nr:hypothetical protein EV356DRAFT_499209 [Viridothelium virens]